MIKNIIYILLISIIIIGCSKAIPDNNIPPIDTTAIDNTPIIKDTIKEEAIKLTIRDSLLIKLESQLNVRETSPNRGPMVDIYNRSVGSSVGVYWCGSFVGYNLSYFNIPNPNSAWSPNYAKSKDIIWKPKLKTSLEPLTGDVFTIYYQNLDRVGHTGFFVKKNKDGYFITIEGNTNGTGSREGDGVYKKKRESDKIFAITRYILDNGTKTTTLE
jgi:hypothetical protein